MTSINRSSYNIMNVKDIIDAAFGNLDENFVNFKLIQTVLFLLANQLRILERRVQIELPFDLVQSSSSFKVTEVKIHAKKKKQISTKQGAPKSDKKPGGSALTSSNKTSTGKSSGRKPSTVKLFTDKTSEEKSFPDNLPKDRTQKSSRNKESSKKGSGRTVVGEISSTSSSETSAIITSDELKRHDDDERKLADNQSILEDLEVKAEKELRVIHQILELDKYMKNVAEKTVENFICDFMIINRHDIIRRESEESAVKQKQQNARADSHEQPTESPTPIASLEMLETQHEKLIVVERVPSDSKTDSNRSRSGPKISVVTQEEFKELAEKVDELQERFEPIGTAKFPENAKLMAELRKTASLTDAMAALQLSARLEAAEKVLGHMISIVTQVVGNTPGIELDDEAKIIFEGRDKFSKGEKTKEGKISKKIKEAASTLPSQNFELPPNTTSIKSIHLSTSTNLDDMPKSENLGGLIGEEVNRDCITYADLNKAIRDICNETMTKFKEITSRNAANTDQAFKIAVSLESKLDPALKMSSRMKTLEDLVSAYAEQITVLDTGLSSQMTSYQEQLTQMQHELEIGLETMMETLANTGGDTVAVTELNNNFLNLQNDFENMGYQQRELQETQIALQTDLKSLWKQIETLRDTKSDRDEVADALRDKAGIGDLNGLVSLEQFDAVRGDFEKRILAAYEKFNNQEIVWQKAIDDLLRELSEKADLVQVLSLKDDINKHVNALKSRMQIIADIVGDPKAASVSKKLFRDTSCLCCSSPATIDMNKPETVPALPKFYDDKKLNEIKVYKISNGDGDFKNCYPDLPIPHPNDPRSHYCRRYCGGSHTLLPPTLSRVPPSTIITPMHKDKSGDDKVYEKSDNNVPCLPCNEALTSDETYIYNLRS